MRFIGSVTFGTDDEKQYHLEIDRVNPNILSAGSPGRIRKVADFLEDPEIEEGDRGLTVVHGEYQGIPVSAFATGMGPASAAITIPEVIEEAEGPITILRLGTAGALQNYVDPGDIVVPTGAIRDESTTSALVGSEFPAYASPELIPVLLAAAEKHDYELEEDVWIGTIHVKDDLYFKESPHQSPSRKILEPKLKSYRRMGAISSSMEFSVYSIMRDFYENRRESCISVGALLAIVARALEGEHVRVDEEVKEDLEQDMIEIGLDVLELTHDLREGKETDSDFEEIIGKILRKSTGFVDQENRSSYEQ